jgi:hypothetical protein
MQYKQILQSIFLLLVIGLTKLSAQEVVPASGGNASGNGGSVCYTIGQISYTYCSGINGSVLQGIQQAYEISIVSGLEDDVIANLICYVYPNPTTDFVMLKVENYVIENLAYQLYDLSGKQLLNSTIVFTETSIDMKRFGPAIYFLKITQIDKVVKTFKIIKH